MNGKLLACGLLLLSLLGPAAISATLINGAGASFPYPIYAKWFSEYQKLHPEVQINYQSIGSGAGIQQFLGKTVDFGASDAPMTDEQLAQAGAPVYHIPTVLGAVVITYNLPGITADLKLTGPVVADLFLGKIAKWNDPELVKLNPGVKLPDLAVLVSHRSDGSGTTNIFSDYLSKVSPDWKAKVGSGTSLKWPVGLGGKGNEGVSGLVKQTPGCIGYVELIYAENNKLPYAQIKNKAGEFSQPSLASVTAAADGALKTIPDDFRVSLTDAAGKKAYPISGFTYLLIWKTMPDAEKATKMVGFLRWAETDGQKFAQPLFYAPLPKSLVSKVEKKIGTIETKKMD
jgi:phosphate transport system substrate-binding protein